MKVFLPVVICLIGLSVLSDSGIAHAQTKSDAETWIVYQPPADLDNGKQIVLISGDEEYRSEEALPMLGQILSQRHGFTCTVLFAINPETGEIDPNNQENIPGIGESVPNADLVIMALRFRNLPDADMAVIDKFLNEGKPVIGLRTSTHAFRVPGDREYARYSFNSRNPWQGGFGQFVLGDTWISHHGAHGRQSTRGVIDAENADHVVLKGVDDVWGDTDVYGIRNLDDSAKILLHGQVLQGMQPDSEPVDGPKNDPMMPLAWFKPYQLDSGKKGMAFCTTMGSATDFASAGLRRLIVNVCYYLTDMEKQIDGSANVDFVADFNPTRFGFNAFKKGVAPADWKLPEAQRR